MSDAFLNAWITHFSIHGSGLQGAQHAGMTVYEICHRKFISVSNLKFKFWLFLLFKRSNMSSPHKLNGVSFLELRQQLESRGIVFSYCGYLNENILTGIGNALQSKMAIDQTDQKISRGIFSTFVEQVQNVIRYSAETIGPEERAKLERDKALAEGRPENEIDDGELRYGLITIGETSDGTRFVTCANLIENDQVERVSTSLEGIRGLNRKELTTLMREHLKAGPPVGSKGAGVGFISIAREANGNWDYEMVPMPDSNFTFFCLEAYF